ncbi:MAG: phage integrase N-terminal SAM-like domain-containing protein [Candidatus Bathyarchaeia archaeon]
MLKKGYSPKTVERYLFYIKSFIRSGLPPEEFCKKHKTSSVIRAALNNFLHEGEGKYSPHSSPPPEGIWEEWREAASLRGYKPSTIYLYESYVRRAAQFAGKPPHELTEEDIRKFMASFRASSGTKNKMVCAFRAFFTVMMEIKKAKRNPARGIYFPIEPSSLPQIPSEEEYQAVLRKVKEMGYDMAYAYLLLVRKHALRHEEIMRLRWEDVSEDFKFLVIKGKRKRVIRLDGEIEEALKKLKERGGEKIFNCGKWTILRQIRDAGDHVGKRISTRGLRWKALVEAAREGIGEEAILKRFGISKMHFERNILPVLEVLLVPGK